MKERYRIFITYWLDRMCESSTWQSIGFLIGLCGSKFGAGMDWGQAAALGGAISGFIKLLLPDTLRK